MGKNICITNLPNILCGCFFFRAYSLLEEAAFLHNYTKAQELVALAYLVCAYFFSVDSNVTKSYKIIAQIGSLSNIPVQIGIWRLGLL